MPNLFSVPPGHCVATLSVQHFMSRHAQAEWPRAVILVPNRRSLSILRRSFMAALDGRSALLPRILPLSEVGNELLGLLGASAFALLEQVPVAMSDAQHRYLLASYVEAFERERLGSSTLEHSLALTDSLMTLQERATRHGVTLTRAAITPLMHADFAEHWKQSLEFLSILTDHWPDIERESGQTTAAAREVRLISLLADYWRAHPAAYPVYAIGSTASQPATAALMQTIADMDLGTVILPGLDTRIGNMEWEKVTSGHPYVHLKHFLDRWPLSPADVVPLVEAESSIWLNALAPLELLGEWRTRALPPYHHLGLIPCAHGEEEVRVISLLLREGLESAESHIAVITPDEGLLERVAVAMQRYGVQVDRIRRGTLSTTPTGSLWAALFDLLCVPDRPLFIRNLLLHPLMEIAPDLLAAMEPGWRGVNKLQWGKLPQLTPELRGRADYRRLASFIQTVCDLSTRQMVTSDWLAQCEALLSMVTSEQWSEAIEESLAQLSYADRFGVLSIEDFVALARERLAAPSRDIGLAAHPRIHLLTPVEARLQRFDRVILAGMQEALWPGAERINPWLNRAAETALGLPQAGEHTSLIAHDVLMHASAGEVFLTYSRRDGESPAPRSRFIEKLVTLLAVHGISEAQLTRPHYSAWAQQLDASDTYAPESPAMPCPTTAQRPARLQVTDVERLCSDPYAIYAKYVLRLSPLKDIDALPDASDFGSISHKAIERLEQHWNSKNHPADESALSTIASHALHHLTERPNIDIFWRNRLTNGLRYINRLEAERRRHIARMDSEHVCEATFETRAGSVTLYGRIDRVESQSGGVHIIDHKTGNAPKEKQILGGEAPQLLTYALIMESLGAPIEALEIWQLPKRGEEGEITALGRDQFDLAEFKNKLISLLETMLNKDEPLLANPLNECSEFANYGEYDGVSRYDEWAG